MAFIDNIGSAAKLWSVQVATAGATVAGIWATMPEPLQQQIIAALPVSPGVAAMLGFLATAVARVLKQPAQQVVNKGGGSGDD